MPIYAIVGSREMADKLKLSARGSTTFQGDSRSWGKRKASADLGYFIGIVESFRSDMTEIVSGGAPGADTLARYYAKHVAELPFTEYLAEWKQFGKAAGPIRNKKIVEKADIMIAFMGLDSRGTRDAVEQMIRAQKPVFIFPYGDAIPCPHDNVVDASNEIVDGGFYCKDCAALLPENFSEAAEVLDA